jgi:hypothetical protein
LARLSAQSGEKRPLRDFQLIVVDERRSVPGLLMVLARDEARAREFAHRVLAESRHHLGVEVLEYGLPLFNINRADVCTA